MTFRSRRITNRRSPKRAYLLVCEGEKTEVLYFKAFNNFGGDFRHVKVTSNRGDQLALVMEAERLRSQANYDQVWCVFDCDSINQSKFERIQRAAADRNVQIAYSNEAFEIWYLLHFDYVNSPIPRSDYAGKLSEKLRIQYQKNLPDMYERLSSKQITAISNAKRLLQGYDPVLPADNNPSTTVHLLVEELNKR